jgi:hypothetical protein
VKASPGRDAAGERGHLSSVTPTDSFHPMNDDLVVIRTYSTEAEANLAAVVLEANAIPARVVADTAGGAIPSMTVLFPVKLVVRAADATLATELLETPAEEPSEDEVGDEEE